MRARTVRLQALVLCLGYAIGGCDNSGIRLWVAALVKSGSLSSAQVGWLASGELFSLAIGVLAISASGSRINARWVAAIGAATLAAANCLALFPSTQTLVIGRLLSGLASGAVQASVIGIATRRPDAQRMLALMIAATVVLMSGVFFVSPILIGRFGLAGHFAILVGLGVVMAIVASIGMPAAPAARSETTCAVAERRLAPTLGCLALAVTCIGQNSVGTYVIAIGNGLGISTRTVGTLIAIAIPLTLLGPLAAHRLGERLGLFRPLLAGLALFGLNLFFLVNADSPILFCFGLAIFGLSFEFCVPYAIAWLGRLDSSGRYASAAPAFMMTGFAVGPALGGKVIESLGFHALAIVSASCLAIGIALFAATVGLFNVGAPARDARA